MVVLSTVSKSLFSTALRLLLSAVVVLSFVVPQSAQALLPGNPLPPDPVTVEVPVPVATGVIEAAHYTPSIQPGGKLSLPVGVGTLGSVTQQALGEKNANASISPSSDNIQVMLGDEEYIVTQLHPLEVDGKIAWIFEYAPSSTIYFTLDERTQSQLSAQVLEQGQHVLLTPGAIDQVISGMLEISPGKIRERVVVIEDDQGIVIREKGDIQGGPLVENQHRLSLGVRLATDHPVVDKANYIVSKVTSIADLPWLGKFTPKVYVSLLETLKAKIGISLIPLTKAYVGLNIDLPDTDSVHHPGEQDVQSAVESGVATVTEVMQGISDQHHANVSISTSPNGMQLAVGDEQYLLVKIHPIEHGGKVTWIFEYLPSSTIYFNAHEQTQSLALTPDPQVLLTPSALKHLIKETLHTSPGQIRGRVVIEGDEQGVRIRERGYLKDGELIKNQHRLELGVRLATDHPVVDKAVFVLGKLTTKAGHLGLDKVAPRVYISLLDKINATIGVSLLPKIKIKIGTDIDVDIPPLPDLDPDPDPGPGPGPVIGHGGDIQMPRSVICLGDVSFFGSGETIVAYSGGCLNVPTLSSRNRP